MTVFGCAREAGEPETHVSAAPPPEAFVLPQPKVRIEADPPPPFTYWAPEGSVIRSRAPGVWYAEVNGETKATYVGDACRASQYQRYVGMPVATLPRRPEGADWVVACATCPRTADLRRDRMDVAFDPETHRILQIRCG